MKKMLVAMSAIALVAQAVSAADVYSSNIVGYQKLSLATGYTFFTPTFLSMGATAGKFKMKDLVPNENFDTEGNDTLQFFTSG